MADPNPWLCIHRCCVPDCSATQDGGHPYNAYGPSHGWGRFNTSDASNSEPVMTRTMCAEHVTELLSGAGLSKTIPYLSIAFTCCADGCRAEQGPSEESIRLHRDHNHADGGWSDFYVHEGARGGESTRRTFCALHTATIWAFIENKATAAIQSLLPATHAKVKEQ